MDLVVIGLLVNVPIVVFGSHFVLKLVERFPAVIRLGAAVLAFSAAKMVVSEPFMDPVFDGSALWNTVARGGIYVGPVGGVMAAGWWAKRRAWRFKDHPT